MPGRQAHGRSLVTVAKAKSGGNKKSKSRAQKNALDAFGIAQENFPAKVKKTPRFRELDAELERKHGRNDDEEEEEEDEDEEQPRKKKAKSRPAADGVDYGSDSEGNEWQLGGMAEDDEDSEIESDDAFGDSDEEKFNGYAFKGSKSRKKNEDDSEEDSDDSNDDEGETLGAEAIDLATALDQFEEESEEEAKKGKGESDSDDSGSDGSEQSSEDDSENDDDDDESVEDAADPEKINALRGLVSEFTGFPDEPDQAKTSTKQKIGLGDLGLSNIEDPFMKRSVKLMNKESKEKRAGASKKLEIPLSRREQGRLDRSAAYDTTNATLDRWTETIKQNRRAEHLIFPLPQNSESAGVDTTEMMPITSKNLTKNELEATIMGIMEESGLSMEKESKPKAPVYDDEGNELTQKEILAKKRMERELQSREAKRAARIKKIKSKAYHRVHRRERERNAPEGEELDSEEEREAQDRRRALERVGQRHKDSKWAKIGNRGKRAVWDDDFRTGLTEMARKDEELRRRKEGRAAVSDSDDTSSSGSDSEDGDASLRRKLDELETIDDEPQSKLMAMKFMQKAEAARKKENDDTISAMRREMDGTAFSDDDEGEGETGRMAYGAGAKNPFTTALDTTKRAPPKARQVPDDDDDIEIKTSNGPSNGASRSSGLSSSRRYGDASSTLIDTTSTENAWANAKVSRKKGTSAPVQELDMSQVITTSRPSKPKSKSVKTAATDADEQAASDSDEDHMPLRIRDRELVDRAFGGEDVAADFALEKEEVAEADDDKVIDNTIPGWGSWVGDGVSKKELARHKGRFLTKVEGVKKKDRKDAKLAKVVISEKRVKKNDRYLATQLPFPFESRAQYERSLRIPVGPEWTTKETFQDSTKPRVLIKQGIIAPMSKPTM